MGNKLLSSPFPSFEQANSQLNALEISHIKKNFQKLRYETSYVFMLLVDFPFSHSTDYISYESFMQVCFSLQMLEFLHFL